MLWPLLEPHFGARGAVGLHELQVMRWLLDTCDSADQARQALLAVKQYYFMVPCHYIVADRAGDSFVYENSTGRNVQHVIDGGGRPQIVTNFQLHRHPDQLLPRRNHSPGRYPGRAPQPLPALHPGPNLSRHPQAVLAHAQSLRAAGQRSRRIT
jgi:hypothetical protein